MCSNLLRVQSTRNRKEPLQQLYRLWKLKPTLLQRVFERFFWIIGLFKKLKRPISRPIVLYNDSQNVITTAHNPTLHSRTKHTLLKYHCVRKQIKQQLIKITYLDTKHIPVDGLTKPLNNHLYFKFLGLLGLKPKPAELKI